MSDLDTPEKPVYIERVVPNLGTFAATFALLPAVALISVPFDIRLGLAIGLIGVLTIWLLLIIRAPLIQVSREKLSVSRVSISRRLIGDSVCIPASQIFDERGPKLDPAAHKVFQGSVKTAVRIPILDPEDPTPYWLISTRRPNKLVAILKNS